MTDITAEQIYFCLIGGILPALLWLFFWLHEDKQRPEPRGLIMATFVGGMLMVPVAAQLQDFAKNGLFAFQNALLYGSPLQNLVTTYMQTFIFGAWSGIEEILKLSIAWLIAIRLKEDDEPIDVIIYMITAALGFAALENTLFMIQKPEYLLNWSKSDAFITGNIRFIGSSLLHICASAIIGVSIALAFYKRKKTMILYGAVGLTTAIVLHTVFNLFIIKGSNIITFQVFGVVWLSVVILMLFFEKIKGIKPINTI